MKLRNQQGTPFSERDLVDIIKGNILPGLAQLIFAAQITDLAVLVKEIKKAENLISSQKPKYGQSQNYGHRVNELAWEGDDLRYDYPEVAAIRAASQFRCWNCQVLGHSFIECPEKRRFFCFKCGMDGVASPNCPNCQGNLRRNPTQTGEERVLPDATQ